MLFYISKVLLSLNIKIKQIEIMTPFKVKDIISVAGGNMGSSSRKYVSGLNLYYQYNDDIVIIESVPRKDLKQDFTIKFNAIIDDNIYFISNEKFDENNLLLLYKEIFNKRIEEIKKTDTTVAETIILRFKDIFDLEINKSFIEVINSYFIGYSSIFTKSVKANLMIKRGFKFNSLKEINSI